MAKCTPPPSGEEKPVTGLDVMHQLQLHLLFPLTPRNREVPNSRVAPAKLTASRWSQHYANSSSQRPRVAWGPGDSSRWWPQRTGSHAVGPPPGPARARLGPGWCGSTPRAPFLRSWAWGPAKGQTPGASGGASWGSERDRNWLGSWRPLGGRITQFQRTVPAYSQHFSAGPQAELVKETSISPSVKWGE